MQEDSCGKTGNYTILLRELIHDFRKLFARQKCLIIHKTSEFLEKQPKNKQKWIIDVRGLWLDNNLYPNLLLDSIDVVTT